MEKKHVLVVDDDRQIRETLRLAFEIMMDLVVIEAQNGQEAIQLIARQNFDLIICDGKMPLIDGPTLLRIIRSEGCTIPFGFLTGESDITRESARIAGAQFCLSKPVEMEDLMEMVNRHISIPV